MQRAPPEFSEQFERLVRPLAERPASL